jgi:hypothetical protein
MRQPKRLRESTIRPPSRWLAEILSRLSGPGGLYNLGNALGFGELLFAGRKIDAGNLCHNIVLISRVPAIIATTADVFSSKAQADGAFAFISLAMLACYLVWAIADSMLLSRDSVVIRLFRPDLARKIRV